MSLSGPARRRALIAGLVAVIFAGGAWLYYVTRDPSRVALTPLSSDVDRVVQTVRADDRFANVDVQVSSDGVRVLVGGEVRDAAALEALRAKVAALALASEVEWRVEVLG